MQFTPIYPYCLDPLGLLVEPQLAQTNSNPWIEIGTIMNKPLLMENSVANMAIKPFV
jgi:hypothetical protein